MYRTGEVPRGTANWLLDLELAYGVFTADKTSMLQQELGLNDPAFAPVIEQHQKFFARQRAQAGTRKAARGRRRRRPGCAPRCARCWSRRQDTRLTDITRELLAENAAGKTAKFDDLVTFGLDQFLWDGLASIYRYRQHDPDDR